MWGVCLLVEESVAKQMLLLGTASPGRERVAQFDREHHLLSPAIVLKVW